MGRQIKYPVIDGMKECGVCHSKQPIGQFRPARQHFEQKCAACKKAYAADYRQRPEVKASILEYSREYRKIKANRDRLNANTRRCRKSPKAKQRRNLTRREWTAREKQKAVDYKGGKCVCCGYSECLAAMDFHHRNPAEKEGYGAGALKAHWTFERNMPELDKCELVCVRCHREIHAGHRSLL